MAEAPNKIRPVVFLDRDGTINVDSDYVTEPSRVELIPGAAKALGTLYRAGYRLLVMSNQSAVGRGMATIEDVEATNEKLAQDLLAEDMDAIIDGFFVCPHHPDDRCDCRKPRTGLISRVREKWDFHLAQCWVIGDKRSDLDFGRNLGVPPDHCVLVLSGKGKEERALLEKAGVGEDVLISRTLGEAAEHIISTGNRGLI